MFMEYARNAMRMAALMKVQNIQVYTHDSIGLGEDGPTHQPVEQVASLRLTPNMSTWRPCDQVESAVAWKFAIERKDGPTSLIFSRQNLAQPMPATDVFDKQDAAYRESVLPSDVTARVAIEAGIADFWYKYVGFDGRIIGMTSFGESAPADQLLTAKELLA